ncbi:MAG TPA: ATP-binding cassette domain-containing protein [Chloroflexota bacterium]|nr:ATP-binding cassette domain-containing protein [Chloroflexota bacterium]
MDVEQVRESAAGAAPLTAEPVVVASELVKRYGDFTAVDGIAFSVRKQECFGFLGPNGAGKTSTMKMIYCRSPITSGNLNVLGHDAHRDHRQIKTRIGVVTQDNDLDTDLSVRQNLAVYALFFGLSRSDAYAKADDLIRFMSLEEKADKQVRELSGGMKRRLTIARALVNDPELLILDEPTTALDPQARLLVWQKLAELKARGVTLIVTTHYMEEAARLCDRLVIMHDGRILTEGAPRHLIDTHVGRYVLELPATSFATDEVTAVLGDHLLSRETHEGTAYLYSSDAGAARRALAVVGLPDGQALAREATLEDVFLRLTGRDLKEAS